MISRTGRSIWTRALTIVLITTSGCAGSSSMRLVEDEINREGTGLHQDFGQNICSYVLKDGTKEEYKGCARIAGGDSLSFWRVNQATRKYTNTPGPSSVSPTGAVLLVLGVGATVALIFAAVSLQNMPLGN